MHQQCRGPDEIETADQAGTRRPMRERSNGETIVSPADEIAQLKQERDEYRDQALRAGPSSPTIRSGPSSRPTPTESTRSARWRKTCSIRSTTSSRAIDALRASGAEGITAGLDMVQKQLLDVLAKHGVEPIAALGSRSTRTCTTRCSSSRRRLIPKGQSSPS